MIRSIAAGVLLAAAAAPNDHWYLAIAGTALLYSVVRNKKCKVRLLRALLAYSSMFLFTLAWTDQFTVAGRIALTLAEAAILAAPLALLPRKQRIYTPIAFVSLTTLAELIRGHFPWGGLPLGSFASGSVDAPYVSSVSIIGEVGLVAVVALLGVAIVELPRDPKRISVAFVALVVAISLIGTRDFTNSAGELTLSTVQGGGPQGLRLAEQQPARVFQVHLSASQNIQDTDVIVWPENVVTVNSSVEQSSQGTALAQLARDKAAYVGAGVVERNAANRTFRNAFVVWSPQGEIVSRYEKRQRVPFGEYVPARSFFNRISDLSQVPLDAVPGRGEAVVRLGDTTAAVGISYEGLFSRLVGSGVRDGGQLIVVPTNAASYEDPVVGESQINGARLRALETGRSVVQAAPTGISAFIQPDGQVVSESRLGATQVIRQTMPLRSGNTPYVTAGDWPLTLIGLLAAAYAIRSGRRSGRNASSPV